MIVLYVTAAICAYLAAGINPAIVMSKLIYHKDIRTCGSGNPGFTNFKRAFGNRWAWWVLVLDLAKAAVPVVVFGYLFAISEAGFQLGAAYTGMFALLGHAYPVWHGFKGGKGFLTFLSVLWFVDWRAGCAATLVMMILLLLTKYMSLATNLGLAAGVVTLLFTGASKIVLLSAQPVCCTWQSGTGRISRDCSQGQRINFTLRSRKHNPYI